VERLGDDIRRSLARVGAHDVGQLSELTRAWPTAVGDAIARAAWPQRVGRDGTLLVATVSATWANELTLLADDVLAKLAAVVGPAAPTGLRFAVGPVPAPAADPAAIAPKPTPAPRPDELELAGDVSSTIGDPDLRKMVQRAIAASLASRRYDPPV